MNNVIKGSTLIGKYLKNFPSIKREHSESLIVGWLSNREYVRKQLERLGCKGTYQ